MKRGFAVAGGLVCLGAILGWTPPTAKPVEFLIGGGTAGYLSPCGCVKPMTGGIRRKATTLATLRTARTITLELGPLVANGSRQSEMKADALGEAFAAMKVDAVGLHRRDEALTWGQIGQVQSLSQQRLITSQLPGWERVEKLGWAIGSLSLDPKFGRSWQQTMAPWADALRAFVDDTAEGQPIALMIDGNRAQAEKILADHARVSLVVFESTTAGAWKVGSRWVASPGERGKQLVRIAWPAGAVTVFPLGPQYKDDAAIELYARYLRRVAEANLLSQTPRIKTDPFAGSASCRSCHSGDYDVWHSSKHATALRTLEKEGHDRDPDCVSCHVVGLESTVGYQSRKETPELTDVGCESCHGPAAKHVMAPAENPLPKIGEESCKKCHNADHSPAFDFDTYWKSIQHGVGKTGGLPINSEKN